jgi:ATP-dependent Clp protease ATP-binding subunit ClpA
MEGLNFTNKAQKIIVNAQNIAREMGQQHIDALHLLLSMITDKENIVLNYLDRNSVDIDDLHRKIISSLGRIPTASGIFSNGLW